MTAAAPAIGGGHGGSFGAVAWSLARRSLVLLRRVPATLVPSIVFPVVIVVAFSGAFGGITRLGAFPVDDMVDWILPMAVVQGAAFSGINVGFGLIREFEDGFFDRLLIAPVHRVALIAGPVLGAMIRALIPTVVVLVAGLAGGARMPGGPIGVVWLTVAAVGAAAVASCWAIGLALRFKDMRAAPLMQIGIFVGIFLSTAQVPLEVMTGWLQTVARWNPTTYILELSRQGFVGHVGWSTTWPGLACLGGALVVLAAFALRGLARVEG